MRQIVEPELCVCRCQGAIKGVGSMTEQRLYFLAHRCSITATHLSGKLDSRVQDIPSPV